MKIIKNIGLSAAGFLIMMSLWLIGSLTNNYIIHTFDVFPEFFIKNPLYIACAMQVLLIVFSVIGKRFNLKALYISALVGTMVPVITYFCGSIFANDGNILSWIYGLTLGLLLYPFGRMAYGVFDGVQSYFFVFHDRFLEGESVAFAMMVVAVISVTIFLIVKKRNKKTEPKDFIQETE